MIPSYLSLQSKFSMPLPGLNAQLKMAPAFRADVLKNSAFIPDDARQSAVLILLYEDNAKLKVLLIKRTDYQGEHSGQMSFPGGKKEASDKDGWDTALRETHEEIGVEPSTVNYLGQLTDIYIPPSNFMVEVFVGFLQEKPRIQIDPREVEQVESVFVEDLMNQSNQGIREFYSMSQNKTVSAPFYYVNNREVWGATAMIISEFLEVLRS